MVLALEFGGHDELLDPIIPQGVAELSVPEFG